MKPPPRNVTPYLMTVYVEVLDAIESGKHVRNVLEVEKEGEQEQSAAVVSLERQDQLNNTKNCSSVIVRQAGLWS